MKLQDALQRQLKADVSFWLSFVYWSNGKNVDNIVSQVIKRTRPWSVVFLKIFFLNVYKSLLKAEKWNWQVSF